MNSKSKAESKTAPDGENTGAYKVVALKYRPQSFGDLVGQGPIATALSNAIDKNRVGHAYLFTGARGVGKTSSARIFAKCLNCEKGPTKTPCGVCDICESVSAGEDVDVLEIDGASNRGIDEIRQLRSNASVRPSRSKYKIYIIDEVHMLTMQAFNALLKTLEEPPAHVKFIFCTTDPQKIPITVLSRCQRFDFSPVQTDEIAKRLKEIAENEGVSADDQALALLARRANGSMRDSQSLLEQLFSFCGTNVSIDEVHQLLGTADMSRIAAISTAMSNGDPTETLNLIHRGMTDGVDAGQMADQLLGYFRDMMAARVGCGVDTMLNCTAPDMEQLATLAESNGLETILTIVQLLDSAVVRMQSSLHSRTLLEAAAVRICNLEKLDSISDLVNSLAKKPGSPKSNRPSPTRTRPKIEMRQVEVKKSESSSAKKNEIAESPLPSLRQQDSVPGVLESNKGAVSPKQTTANGVKESTPAAVLKQAEDEPGESAAVSSAPASANAKAIESATSKVNQSNVETFYQKMLDDMGDMTADMASHYVSLVMKNANQLVVTLSDTVNRDLCAKPERNQKFESAFELLTGQKIRIDFIASELALTVNVPAPKLSRVQQIRKLQEVAFVKQTISLFDAEITGYQEPAGTKKR